jgi:hypothetical protein
VTGSREEGWRNALGRDRRARRASGTLAQASAWTHRAATLTIVWLREGDRPDHDLLLEQATRLGGILGCEFELNVRAF